MLWPPAEPGGYSLIVDGRGQLIDDSLRVVPHRAVLHRPAVPAFKPPAVRFHPQHAADRG